MDSLVDIFYYDYILIKIIEMYHSNTSSGTIVPYLKVATSLSKKFRDDKVHMDRQIYLKEIYVKAFQILKIFDGKVPRVSKNPNYDEKVAIHKTLDCLDLILRDLSCLSSDEDFKTIRNIAFALYTVKGRVEGDRYYEKVEKAYGEMDEPCYREANSLVLDFSYSKLLENLQTVKFGNPVMKKFVDYVRDDIDIQKEKKSVVGGTSPGNKIEWK